MKICSGILLTTNFPTPEGWKAAADLQIGDTVFTGDGYMASIVKRHITKRMDLFSVTSDDKRRIIVGSEQAFMARPNRYTKKLYRMPTSEIYTRQINGARSPMLYRGDPLNLPQMRTRIAPWVLGYWLGNGSKASAKITTHGEDAAWLLKKLMVNGYTARIIKDYRPLRNCVDIKIENFIYSLKKYSLIKNKHIPEIYFRLNEGQRLELIQGLMDSDGYVSPGRVPTIRDYIKNDKIIIKRGTRVLRGACEFTSTNRYLAEGFRELLSSMGVKSSLYVGRATLYQKDCGPKFRVQFFYEHAATSPRKSINLRKPKKGNRYIKVEKLEFKDHLVILEIDDPTHTILCGEGMLPIYDAHNYDDIPDPLNVSN